MAYPVLYDITYSYTGFQQAQGDNSFPGTQLDADLAGLQTSIADLTAFVETVIRSDGKLYQLPDAVLPATQAEAEAGTEDSKYMTPLKTRQSFNSTRKKRVLLGDGQSNVSRTMPFAWTPNPNVFIWNNAQDATGVGTAFVALSSTTVGIAEKMASDIADATGDAVYLIKNGYSGLAISHWLTGTSAPDMYANGVANVVAALATLGAAKIDYYLRWQGEADQTPSINTSYIANFATMMSRYWTNACFPRETPAVICGIVDSATSGSSNADTMNLMLEACVNLDPDTRRWVCPSSLAGATFWNAADPGHMTGLGYYTAGALAAHALVYGPGRNTLAGVLADPASGKVVIGNPAKGSAPLTLNLNAVGATTPTTGAILDAVQTDGSTAFLMATATGAPSGYVGRAAAGTLLTPTAVSADTLLVFFGAQGHDGSAWTGSNVGNLKIYAAENWTSAAHGTYTVISNTKLGTLTQVDCLRVDPGSMTLFGTISGSLKISIPSIAGSNTITFPAGTTDFSATGGAGKFVKQATAGGAFTVVNIVAADLPAFSGDMTTSAGSTVSTVTKINGDDQTTAWAVYAPTVTSSAGGFTTVSATGRWKRIGKTVIVEADVTITAAGTAAGGLQVSLPLAAAAFEYVGNAIEIAVTAKSGAARIPAGGTTMNAFDATGTTFIASGRRVTMTAVYEIP